MSLHQLVYQSRALVPFDPAELAELLRRGRLRNRHAGVTSLLLLTPDGRFLQVLEGERDAVHRVFRRIAADPRHHECHVVSEAPCTERTFPEWEMAYCPAQAGTLRTVLAPVPPPPTAALLLPRPHTHLEIMELLLEFMARQGCLTEPAE